MATELKPLEKFTLFSPFGVRFWDAHTGQLVPDGLQVKAYQKQFPNQTAQAVANKSGIYVFQSLPGLREIEIKLQNLRNHPTKGTSPTFWDDFWADLTAKSEFVEYVIEVEDLQKRFIGCKFKANLPVRGLFELNYPAISAGSPPSPLFKGVPLFSAPGRATPAGMAVVRATLTEDAESKTPVSFALLKVQAPGHPPVYGVSDSNGQAVIFLTYPRPKDFEADSDPTPLHAQEWTVTLRAFSKKPHQTKLDVDYLFGQVAAAPADLWNNLERTVPLADQTLKFGQELIVRTIKTSSPLKLLPVLLVSPAS
jgi:hypothetical protein